MSIATHTLPKAAMHPPKSRPPWEGESRAMFGVRLVLVVLLLGCLGLFLARASLALCLAAVAGCIGLVLVALHPTLAVYALAFTIPFGSLSAVSLGALTVGPSELVLTILAAAWLLRMAARRQVRITRSWLTLFVALYVGTLLISVFPTRNLGPAVKELSKWVEFLLLYLYVAGVSRESEQQGIVAALLLAGMLEGLLGIYQFLRGVGPPGFILLGRYMRAYGTFEQPNPFGGYMGLLLPLAYVTVITQGRSAWLALKRGVPWLALFWCLAVAASLIMGAALVMSWSRGALLGLGVGIALLALALARAWLGRKFILSAVAIGLLLLLLAAPEHLSLTSSAPVSLYSRLTDTLQYVGAANLADIEITDENFAVIERAAHWLAAWRMFEQHPWLGVGPGQYADVYPSVALPRWQDPLGHAHNYVLNVMAEGGLVGLAAYLLLTVGALWMAWRAGWQRRGWPRAVAWGVLGMMGHLLAHNMFDNLYVHGMYLLVAIALGLLVSGEPVAPAPNPSIL